MSSSGRGMLSTDGDFVAATAAATGRDRCLAAIRHCAPTKTQPAGNVDHVNL
jgi:hypothetical protein